MNSKKLLHSFLLFSLILVFNSTVYGQSNECGFVMTQENTDYFNSIKDQLIPLEQQFLEQQSLANRSSTVLNSVPIKAHIIRQTDGTGGLTVTELNDAITTMNSIYLDAGLEFYLCDTINYIDDDNFYDYETDDESALLTANSVADIMNIYFTDDITSSSSGGGLCGYARFPGGAITENILMANSCATNGSTLSHEVGHFFALTHTHGSSNSTTTEELVDGSNCETTGDFICDTPADPQLGYGNVNASCIYTDAAQDANFDYYQPDPLNLMSYSRKECRTLFSPQQYARINAIASISRNNLTCASFNADFTANETQTCNTNLTVNFSDNSVGATSWSWDVNGDDIVDYTTQNPSHTYNTVGNYDVILTISNGTTAINTVKSGYINVGAIEASTTTVSMSLTLDDAADETSWEFRDSNNNVLYSGGPYTGIFDGGSTRNETFNVNPDECYSFVIYDTAGNGICCSNGNGSYELTADDNSVLASGTNFSSIKKDNIYSGILSVNDFSLETLSLFPNPSSNSITITSKSLPDTYEIYNTLGQVIKTSKVKSNTDLNVNIESLNSGMYFIKLTKDNSSQVLSFVKN